ncbi:delta-12 fatty acid desaturase [Hymenopellis radicata]|nr:delta-12 fatty acid desaturase [Hymenopellis radicata]
MASLFRDSPEYEARRRTPFTPTKLSMPDIHAAVPAHLRNKNTIKALVYVCRGVTLSVALYYLATTIEPVALSLGTRKELSSLIVDIAKWSAWSFYWLCQGILFAGFFTLGHEAGHGTLSPYAWVNETVGFVLHMAILVPYHAWKSSHHAHHKATMSLERDQHYIPPTRSSLNVPPKDMAEKIDYWEILGEAPLYTLIRIIAMQLFGWQAYLLFNEGGNPKYRGRFPNHFLPSSPLFRPDERWDIIKSDLGLLVMGILLSQFTTSFGVAALLKFYIIPYFVRYFLVPAKAVLTILRPAVQSLAYHVHVPPACRSYRSIYRRSEWTFVRGALSTVDRPFLGWIGRFFLHNASHDHVAHHLFSSIPFCTFCYNLPAVTEHLKPVLKDDYNYDSTNSFWALYRTFRECCFVEDDGDILFYKNKKGQSARSLAISKQ